MSELSVHSPPSAPPGEAADAARAEEVAVLIQRLLRGIKNIGIYRHAEDRYIEYLEPAYSLLTDFLDANGSLPLKLGPFTLHYKRHVVYEDEDRENLTYKFYRDGVRYMVFRPGVPIDELLRFVLLALGDFSEQAFFQEDMVTRFWKEEFEYIDNVVVEGFGFGDLSEEEVEIEVDKIIGYLRKQLAARSKDIARFARTAAEDLELELTNVEQVRGGIVSGRPATAQDKARLQDELLSEQRSRLFAKMVLILFQVLELDSTPSDQDMLMESITHVLDLFLVAEDVRGAVGLLHRFDRLQDRPMPRERRSMVLNMREAFRRRMVEQHRLAQVGQYLQLSRGLDEEAVRAYLSTCGEQELIPLVEMLFNVERTLARQLLIEVLADVGKDHVDIFARRLDDNSSNLVRDMLAIIERIDPPNRIDLAARCLEHPNIMIRLEGLRTLSKSEQPEALRYIEKALGDEDVQMRLGALRALAARSPERAGPMFIKAMQAPDFLQREQRERITVATALGETRTREALDYLASIFGQKPGVFNRGKLQDMKMLAVVGLQAMKNMAAFKVLASQVQNRNHPMEVLQACRKAALRLKEHLEKEREHG